MGSSDFHRQRSIAAGWTDERAALAKKLWTVDGYSASQIANTLRGGVSRNAVIGKLFRMGLTGDGAGARKRAADLGSTCGAKAAPTRRYGPRVAPALKIAGRGTIFEEAEARAARVVVPFRDEPAGLRTVETIGPRECHWPIGDPQNAGFTLCGGDAEGPYCPVHATRAYTSHATRAWVDQKLAMPAKARFS